MKKKLAILTGLVALLAFLGIFYVLYSDRQNAEETENTVGEQTADKSGKAFEIINKGENVSLTRLRAERKNLPKELGLSEPFDLGDNVMNLYLKDDSYFIEGYEDIALDDKIEEYIDGFYTLYGSSELKKHEGAEIYGLDNPSGIFTAEYSDGTSLTLTVGNVTADGLGFYASISGSDSVFVITRSIMTKYFYGLNDLTDKSLTDINISEVCLVSVKNHETGENLFISYSDAAAEAAADGNVLTSLVMKEPVDGLSVYGYNLETTIFAGKSSMLLTDIAAIKPSDLSAYGLDSPRYSFTFGDTEKTLSLEIGDKVNDTYSYCMVPGRNIVYLMLNSAIEPCVNYNIYEFVERFVDLQYRRNLSGLKISQNNGEEYTITFGEDSVGDEKVDNRVAVLNGKEYSRTEISDLYQLITGIVFERIEENKNALPTAEPELIITYNLLDGSSSKDEYISYDNNYYVVNKNGENTGLIVSKSYVSRMLSKLEEMSE